MTTFDFIKHFSVFLSRARNTSTRAKATAKTSERTTLNFTVVFYGLKIFGCKTAQLCVTRREDWMAKMPSVSDGVQRSENKHKNSLLNYEFASVTDGLLQRAQVRRALFRTPQRNSRCALMDS
jgi:hypothetical protein